MSSLSPVTLPPRSEVEHLCVSQPVTGQHEYVVWKDPNTSEPLFFIKYSNGHNDLLAEARTQKYIYDRALNDPDAPRVPKVYDVWQNEAARALPRRQTRSLAAACAAGRTLIPLSQVKLRDRAQTIMVMEYVHAPNVQEWLQSSEHSMSKEEHERRQQLCDKHITRAVKWLLDLEVPRSIVTKEAGPLGPIGGGIAHHSFFDDHEAPLAFRSVPHLQDYINDVCAFSYRFRLTSELFVLHTSRFLGLTAPSKTGPDNHRPIR